MLFFPTITLKLGPDSGGILGDGNGDSATINTNCSAATFGTTKSFLLPPINYLTPTLHISSDWQLANQSVRQEGYQVDSQGVNQDDFLYVSQVANLRASHGGNQAENQGIQIGLQHATQPVT